MKRSELKATTIASDSTRSRNRKASPSRARGARSASSSARGSRRTRSASAAIATAGEGRASTSHRQLEPAGREERSRRGAGRVRSRCSARSPRGRWPPGRGAAGERGHERELGRLARSRRRAPSRAVSASSAAVGRRPSRAARRRTAPNSRDRGQQPRRLDPVDEQAGVGDQRHRGAEQADPQRRRPRARRRSSPSPAARARRSRPSRRTPTGRPSRRRAGSRGRAADCRECAPEASLVRFEPGLPHLAIIATTIKRPWPVTAPAFYYDLLSPYSCLAAFRLERVLPVPAEWRPIWAAPLIAASGRDWRPSFEAGRERRADIVRRAARYGMPEWHWPSGYVPADEAAQERWEPPNTLAVMRLATFAHQSGVGEAFAPGRVPPRLRRGP